MAIHKLTILFCVLLPFSAWSASEEASVRKEVRSQLKDPDSAKFGKFTMVGKDRACLTVNSKNVYGGYTGDQQAYMYKIEGKWDVAMIQPTSIEYCIQYFKDQVR